MSLLALHEFASPALYLDPGSGSFLIQLLLAAGLGISVAVKMYWSKIQALFGKKKTETTDDNFENDEE